MQLDNLFPDIDPTPEEYRAILQARLARVRAEMKTREIGALVLFDPVNMRYCVGSRNMQIYSARNPARYVFISAEGPVVLFEFGGCMHLAEELMGLTLTEVRPATAISYYFSGNTLPYADNWADEIAELMKNAPTKRIGLESATADAAFALQKRGFEVVDAQESVERARAVKVPNEIKLIKSSIAAVEKGVERLAGAIRPGLSENAIWSHLFQSVIESNGDYIETRLLASGPRTNPWFQECGPREIEAGDIVALDTDVVGRYGYYTDFSRTFYCGTGRANDEVRKLFRLSYEQVQHNLSVIRPGLSFREFAEQAWAIPEPYRAHRYFCMSHGVGMTGEYPYIPHVYDFDTAGYDGIIEPGMTLCVESFIGDESGGPGVKLEEQILVTETGIELLTRFPYDESLLSREV